MRAGVSNRSLVALLGVLAPAIAFAQPGGSVVSVSGQWVRSLGGTLPAAGYFTLRNDGAAPVRLTGAASPACGSLTLHETVRQHTMSAMSALDPNNPPGGMARMSSMQPVAQVLVPGHASIRFAPGGFHLMCEQPTAAVRPGQQIEVTLRLDHDAVVTSAFPVRGPRGG